MKKKTTGSSFAVCVKSRGADDLLIWKLYRVKPDADAEKEGYLRVVDESGEDYLYPESRFVVVRFPAPVQRRILRSKSSVA